MRSVGLTGNIASGKSTVARLLHERHGLPVLDADEVARWIVEPGSPALTAIQARFGPEVLTVAGRLDRQALGAIIRRDPQARRELEAITHPAIYERIDAWLEEQRRQRAPLAVVEAALLVETGQQDRFDLLLVVSCSQRTQVARLMARNHIGRDEALAWLDTQLPAADKERHADIVIRNDGTPQDLEHAVARASKQLLGHT